RRASTETVVGCGRASRRCRSRAVCPIQDKGGALRTRLTGGRPQLQADANIRDIVTVVRRDMPCEAPLQTLARASKVLDDPGRPTCESVKVVPAWPRVSPRIMWAAD